MLTALRSIALLAGLAATPALAHPHIFIDTKVEFLFDANGDLAEVRIEWTYDEFTSMLILADRGIAIDASFTEGQTGRLSGFDMNWIEDYPGDSYLYLGDQPIALSRPRDWATRVENGVITTWHLRQPEAPIALKEAQIKLQVYDPTYYTAYTIADAPVLTGRQDCTAQVYGPDPTQAAEILRQALAELSGAYSDEDFPAIGAEFSEEIRLTCPAR